MKSILGGGTPDADIIRGGSEYSVLWIWPECRQGKGGSKCRLSCRCHKKNALQLLIFIIPSSLGSAPLGWPQLDKTATCSLKCPTGTVIVIKDAFWGREDKKICRHVTNKHLQDWNTNCGTGLWDRHKARGVVQYMWVTQSVFSIEGSRCSGWKFFALDISD